MKEPHTHVGSAGDSLFDQIADEITDRFSRGETPDVEEFVARYPQWAEVIRQLFPALAALASPASTEFCDVAYPESTEKIIGDFRLIRQIGRGGMGIVYEAHQISLQRRVALKILPFAAVLDPRQLQRFKIEAQAAAGLHHPHIVPVHSVGTDRGVHYYAMQYVDGQDLATVLKQLRLSLVDGQIAEIPAVTRVKNPASTQEAANCEMILDPHASGTTFNTNEYEAEAASAARAGETMRIQCHTTQSLNDCHDRFRTIAELGIQAAEALDYAHQRGIIHRDIKPSNLLIDGEGVLWITDFGLAQMESEGSLTMTGDFIGTLQYMSPEQALGHRGLVDQRTDIYALGVTLYELLTCQPMLAMADKAVMLKKISEEDPPLPSSFDRKIPADLETIVLKATAKEPEARYASAVALAADLRHYLELRPILAKRPGVWDRLAKWSRRNHTLVSSLAAILLMAVVALSLSIFFVARAYQAESKQRKIAELQTRRGDDNLKHALQAVNEMLTEVASDEIVDVPQMATVRRELLQKAVGFLEQLLAHEEDDPAVQYETARAYVRITDIHEALGEFELAENTANRAIAMLKELIDAEPRNVVYRDTLTEVYGYLGLSYFQRRPTFIDDALATCKLRLDETQRLVQDFPDELRLRCRFAEVNTDMGNFHWEAQHHHEAEIYLRKAVRIWNDISSEYPDAADGPDEAHCRQWLGTMLLRTLRFDEAEPELLFANRVYEQLVQAQPDNTEIRGRLAQNRSYLGELYFQQGDYNRSGEFRRKATHLRELLAEEFPNVYEHKRRLAVCYQNLISTLGKEQQFDEARVQMEKQRALRQDILTRFPQLPGKPGGIGWGACDLATMMYETGHVALARQNFSQALQDFELEVEHFPQHFRAQHWLSWFLVRCPISDLRNPHRALPLAKQATLTRPASSDAWCVLGVAEYRCGHFEEAITSLNRAAELSDNDVSAVTQYVLAMIDWEQDRHDEAVRRFSETEALKSAALMNDPTLKWIHDEAAMHLGLTSNGE
ncbi:Serine/threonine-protein kinase PknB [Symmachiella macrocystis]|uniref:Serine/threonine-protein kinase PknB n=1 Tax=Symmachiella macrocystis TaxID=2527985 RepID=A0A5C6BRC2_9PLAN|nr:serine/threonine-protein kinase [Symmachiella macrocystis]TWU14783.1 Serine/threonine-protein kinase PknB [Symmachiella macrocystis]